MGGEEILREECLANILLCTCEKIPRDACGRKKVIGEGTLAM
jgi:hypothetical protein